MLRPSRSGRRQDGLLDSTSVLKKEEPGRETRFLQPEDLTGFEKVPRRKMQHSQRSLSEGLADETPRDRQMRLAFGPPPPCENAEDGSELRASLRRGISTQRKLHRAKKRRQVLRLEAVEQAELDSGSQCEPALRLSLKEPEEIQALPKYGTWKPTKEKGKSGKSATSGHDAEKTARVKTVDGRAPLSSEDTREVFQSPQNPPTEHKDSQLNPAPTPPEAAPSHDGVDEELRIQEVQLRMIAKLQEAQRRLQEEQAAVAEAVRATPVQDMQLFSLSPEDEAVSSMSGVSQLLPPFT